MKSRKKHILSRNGVGYKVIIDDDNQQMKIIWLLRNNLRINLRKRELQNVLNSKGLKVEMLGEEQNSVTYKCPKYFQKTILKIIAKL